MAELKEKIQTGLDETRILVLGAQVLIGFQFASVFQKGFDKLPAFTQNLKVVGLGLMLFALVLLMWPTAYHRIVCSGRDLPSFHRFITHAAAPALLPFAMGLGIDLFVAGEKILTRAPAIALGTLGAATALWFWYGLEAWVSRRHAHSPRNARENELMEDEKTEAVEQPNTAERVKHVLTETRVVLPGAQALLGFQFAAMLTEEFERLPPYARQTHLAALLLVAFATILLMTPAAYHRIVERGENTEHFHHFTSKTLLAAMAVLAAGISADFFLVVLRTSRNSTLSVAASVMSLAVFYGFWFGYTLFERARTSGAGTLERKAAPPGSHWAR